MKYLLLVLLLASCARPAEEVTKANANFEVSRLFEFEGCTVYRFLDAHEFIYYTNCSGNTQWQQSCGKNCTRSERVTGGRNDE